MELYIHRNGEQFGPYTEDEVRSDLLAGTIQLTDLAWYEGAEDWTPLSAVPGFARRSTPPPVRPAALRATRPVELPQITCDTPGSYASSTLILGFVRHKRPPFVKATLRRVLVPIGTCWFIAIFVAGFLAYFVSSAGSPPTDGLGRPLSDAPLLMRFFFGQERMWAGWAWFVADIVIFWGSIALAVNISTWLDDSR